jgi:hypothetical protein
MPMPLVWDEETGTVMDSETWDLLLKCDVLDFQAGLVIGYAEEKIRMEKLFLAIDEAYERSLAEGAAEARHLQA